MSVTNKWQNSLTKHKQVAAIFLDIRKAFDSVPHNKIISSLSKMGISGPLLSWFKDYLTGRSQRVVLEGCMSDPTRVTSGVPQGSILGPLMFNIFINSITDVHLSQDTELILYADDILLFKPIDSQTDVKDLQLDINRIVTWIGEQGLSPNHSKTQLLPITRCRRLPAINLTVNGHPIAPSKSVKYLGVSISSNLTWSDHIRSVCKSAKRQLGMMHRQLRHAPAKLRHQIYKTTTLPKLEYCCAIWDPRSSVENLALENVQKFAGRVITGKWKEPYPILLEHLNWLPLTTRRKIQKLKVCYNLVNNNSCIPSDIFTPHPHPSPRFPHSKPLFKPFVSTIAHKSSFFIEVISHWNTLPKFIVDCTSSFSFKKKLHCLFST